MDNAMIFITLPDMSGDDGLLDAARRQDSFALRTIYERYFTPIYQFLRLRLDDREQAQDLTADVFVDFYVALQGRSAPKDNLRAWLFRVARNKLYDAYGKRKQFNQQTLDEWIPAPNDDPEQSFLHKSQRVQVQKALAMLNSEQQEVLILRFGQGLNLQETADLMGKQVGAIKSLQFRALERLRQALDAQKA